MQQLNIIKLNQFTSEDMQAGVDKIKEKAIGQLIWKCLNKPEENNVHIFKKECELLA